MALPELTKKQIETTLGEFCQNRIPPNVRNKLRLVYNFRGNTVTLIEERPYFQDPTHWTSSPVAQFRFDLDRKTWSLYCRDRNCKWHLYDHLKPSRQFDNLLRTVDGDPSGIFWG